MKKSLISLSLVAVYALGLGSSVVYSKAYAEDLSDYLSVIAAVENGDQTTALAKTLDKRLNDGGWLTNDMKAADLTDPSVAQKLKNSFISQQVNTTTNKSPDMAWLWVQEKNLTASEQVELAGWMYGSDAAKKMAAQFIADGVPSNATAADMNASLIGNPNCKSTAQCYYTSVALHFANSNAGVNGDYSNPGAKLVNGMETMIGANIKGNVVKLLSSATGVSAAQLSKLSNAQIDKLAGQYLGVSIDSETEKAMNQYSQKIGLNLDELAKAKDYKDLVALGLPEVSKQICSNAGVCTITGNGDIDNAKILPAISGDYMSFYYSFNDLADATGGGKNLMGDIVAQSMGIKDIDALTSKYSGEDLVNALGVDSTSLDFNTSFDELSAMSAVAGGNISLIDTDAMKSFLSSGSSSQSGAGFGGGSYKGGSGSNWIIM